MKVAAIQMVASTQRDLNLTRARALLEQAAQAGAELAVLPEYFCVLGQRDTDKLAVQETLGDGPIQQCLSAAARDFGLWLVGGTLPLTVAPSEGDATASATDAQSRATPAPSAKVFNSTLVYDPQGQRVARYDKRHLFRFDNGVERYDESRTLQAGSQPAMFELPSIDGHRWRVALSICYDLRFPELYRAYAQAGADLLLVPSAFTHTTGQAHWEPLLRARAIENLAFVVAAAQGGVHENGRQTWGHTSLIDPWGRVLAQQAQGEGVVLAELDAQRLQQCRQQLPALEHRAL